MRKRSEARFDIAAGELRRIATRLGALDPGAELGDGGCEIAFGKVRTRRSQGHEVLRDEVVALQALGELEALQRRLDGRLVVPEERVEAGHL